MVVDASQLNLYTNNYTMEAPHALSYNEIVTAIGGQIVDKFLIIGVVFIIYSYWNVCGMRHDDFDGPWDSYPKRLMINLFHDRAAYYTKWVNGFLDGLCSSLAIVAISMWIMYQFGW